MTADPKRRAVLALLRADLWPIPVWWPLPDGRCACGKADCDASGKHPIGSWKEYQRRAPRPSEVHNWLDQYPEANWGVVLGEDAGVIAADMDGPGAEHLLLERGIELPESATALSARGAKVLLKHPGGRLQRKIALVQANGSAVDLLADGSQVVVPPSRHYTGTPYRWAIPLSAGISVAPAALLELARARNGGAKEPGSAEERTAPECASLLRGVSLGSQHDSSLKIIGRYLPKVGPAETWAILEDWCDRCDPPADKAKVRANFEDICAREAAKSHAGTEHLTDLGNARRLVARHRNDLRYCFPWGKWLHWDGCRWADDESGEVFRRGKETVAAMYAEAAALTDEKARAALAGHALKSEADGKIRAMLSLARSEPGVPILPADLDQDPWLLNVLNGTLDLRTGLLREHRREDYLSRLVPIAYDAAAEAPGWLAFLESIFPDKARLIRFLQKAIGYCLTGDTREQYLFFCHGRGANGKTTLLRMLQYLLADYARQAAPDLLLVKHGSEHPTGLADLAGARLVVCIETDEGKRLAEALVKQMTGGDKMKARKMREDFWEWQPTHKTWLAANHRPEIRGTDYAIWRRIRLIPFTVTIPEVEQDRGLLDKLRTELPGILAWAVQGCLAWQQEGLQAPPEVLAATAEYREESDVVGCFLEERCILGTDLMVPARDLYAAYAKWCEESGEKARSQTTFGNRLSERGLTSGRQGGGGKKSWHGATLNP